ncbi:MAG: hypothetical protein FJ038_00560 [Chloroflexi bacterium]|nr:hypothetical protein [Chloroflexota bacterium]
MTGPGNPGVVEVTGIVLAGGRSARFGRDKLAELLDGRTLLDRAVDALAIRCSEVLVIGAADGPDPVLHPIHRGTAAIRVLRDPEVGGGPLVGLAVGLEAAAEAIVLVAGGDMPSLDPSLLSLLADEVAARAGAAALQEGGHLRPLPCAIDRARAGAALRRVRAAGRSSLHAILESLDAVVVAEDVWRVLDPEGASLIDVDRPGDLARGGGRISEGPDPRAEP